MAKDEPVRDEHGFCQRVNKGETMQVLLSLTKSLKCTSHQVELVLKSDTETENSFEEKWVMKAEMYNSMKLCILHKLWLDIESQCCIHLYRYINIIND